MMNKLYFFVLICAAGAALYCLGRGVGGALCREKSAAYNANAALVLQTKIIEKQRKIDVEVVNTGGDDIRRILREKYTITE